MPDVKGATLVDFAHQMIDPGSTISSDKYHPYQVLAKEGYRMSPSCSIRWRIGCIPSSPKQRPLSAEPTKGSILSTCSFLWMNSAIGLFTATHCCVLSSKTSYP
ncbi:hypothetical protein [Paenibacillus phocaensis]|uniref:hypothetical protein n=1 Tax=Paenibacillus phocaensis TaxID=1776378 RepID=UPI0038CDAD22